MDAQIWHIDDLEEERLPGGARVKRVITKEKTKGDITISIAQLAPAQGHEWHTHEKEDEAIYVISGEGVLSVRDKEIPYKAGDSIFIRRGTCHQNMSKGDSVLVAVFNPAIR